MGAEQKLKELGINLPDMQTAMANYVPYVITGNLVYVAGQGPMLNGQPLCTGKLGREVTIEQGYEASKATALNLMAVLRQAAGSLDNIERIVNLHGYVNSTDDFESQPAVINGASDLLVQVFGDRGRHTRCAFSTNSLPMNTTVEIELIAEIKKDAEVM